MDLSTSPTRSLSSWWKSFKQRELAPLAERGAANGAVRPSMQARSRSSNNVSTVAMRSASPMVVVNEGKHVEIPFEYQHEPIFGVPLRTSMKYASVRISLSDREGRTFVYGRVPVVVARCCLFLKQSARETPGIFRVSGSQRRVRLLQDSFSQPPRFGKDFDWTGFSVHDAANLLRRFLNNLPEPIIPFSHYNRFRGVLRSVPRVVARLDAAAALLSPSLSNQQQHVDLEPSEMPGIPQIDSPVESSTDQANSLSSVSSLSEIPSVRSLPQVSISEPIEEVQLEEQPAYPQVIKSEPQVDPLEAEVNADEAQAVKLYKQLIFELPPENRQLLVYLLDLLALFHSHAHENMMSAFNLSAIFQPCVIAHPSHEHDMSEFRISRMVLEFLILNAPALLRHVERLALEEHEEAMLRAAESGAGIGPSPPHTRTSSIQDLLVVPETGSCTSHDSGSLDTPSTLGDSSQIKIPASAGLSHSHRRRHSKSVGSAQAPMLIFQGEPVGRLDLCQKPQLATPEVQLPLQLPVRDSYPMPSMLSPDSRSSSGLSPPATRPERSDSMKQRLRRSILFLKHDDKS